MHKIHNKCNGMKGIMCPCPDFNCASCLGIASPMDGTVRMEVEFGDEKKQSENTHQEKVQVGKDQEKAQSEKDSHSKNRGGKKPN